MREAGRYLPASSPFPTVFRLDGGSHAFSICLRFPALHFPPIFS